MTKYENEIMQKKESNEDLYRNHTTLFIYGEEIAKRPTNEFQDAFRELNRKPTEQDLINIIRNRA